MEEKKNRKEPFDDRNIEKEQEKLINKKSKRKEKMEDSFFDYLKRKNTSTQK